MKSLVSLGYMEYDLTARTYFPTSRMNLIVAWVEGKMFKDNAVLNAMERLHDATSESISLAVQSDLHAQYIHQLPTKLPLPYPRIRQTIRPLAASGVGWLMLSAWDEETIRHLARRLNYANRNADQRVDIDQLLHKVNEIKQNGYVFSKNTIVDGAGMVGMLVPSKEKPDQRRFALCVQGPVDRLEEKLLLIVSELKVVTNAIGTLGGIR